MTPAPFFLQDSPGPRQIMCDLPMTHRGLAEENPGDEVVFIKYYILTLTRLRDYDDGAAKTGVTEAANVVTVYHHPTNNKIKFWDLPSIGTYQMLQ